jgi:8-oxo-dGTP pyrophosphatase MutT (NUDIX family)
VEKKELAWTILNSTQVADCRIFTVHRNLSQRPRSTDTCDFYVLRCPNWVQVLPMTASGEVLLIEQYRPGTDSVTLETPGGIVDPQDESSEKAGVRELLEETGYRAEKMVFLGRIHANPSIQGNHCDAYLATNIEKVQEPNFDEHEEIEPRLVPYTEIPELIKTGAISHSLVIAAFYYLQLHMQN